MDQPSTRILMVAPQPFFEPRGTPISVYSRLHLLSLLNAEVDLVTYPYGASVLVPGVTIHRTFRLPFLRHVKIGPSFPKLLLDVLLFFTTLRLLITRRYDVIHSHEEAAFFCVLFSWIFRIQHVYDMHSSLPRQLENFKFAHWRPVISAFEILERWVIRNSAAVITVGTDLERYVWEINAQAYCTNIENLPIHEVIGTPPPDSLDDLTERFALQGRLPIVYTGTLERYQGLNLLFEGVARVVKQHPEAIMLIVGGTPAQIAEWQEVVSGMGLADWVIFVGQVPLSESLRFLALAEILVSPRYDGTSVPLKIYTYMRSGKPIVATSIFAHTQILSEQIAVLVEPNADSLADGIIRLIESPALRQRIGEQACATAAERYSAVQQAHKLQTVYQHVSMPEGVRQF